MTSVPSDSARELLRHVLATLAYRGGKALRGVGPEAAGFRAGATTRTPLEILGHVNDLFDWGLNLCDGRHLWHESAPVDWEAEAARFHRGLAALDARLAAPEPLGFPAEKIFQGPLADALTHVGQIALLRRLAGAPVRGENYFRARIEAGRLGADQAAPVREFD